MRNHRRKLLKALVAVGFSYDQLQWPEEFDDLDDPYKPIMKGSDDEFSSLGEVEEDRDLMAGKRLAALVMFFTKYVCGDGDNGQVQTLTPKKKKKKKKKHCRIALQEVSCGHKDNTRPEVPCSYWYRFTGPPKHRSHVLDKLQAVRQQYNEIALHL